MKKLLLILATITVSACSTTQVQPANIQTGSVNPIAQKLIQTFNPVLRIHQDQLNFNEYIPTIMFHYIEKISPQTSDQLRYRLSFSPKRLEQYLEYFKQNDIQTLTYRDLKQIREGKKEMPKRAVMLTFDDGDISHYTKVFPLLEKYNAKGVFFIIASKPNNDGNYANRDQIREIQAAGHEIGGHTMTHADLRYVSEAGKITEIVESKKIIEKEIGRPVISFCYPAGKYNQKVLDIVGEHYIFARSTHPGKQIAYANRYELPTVRMFPESGMNVLRGMFPTK